MQGSNQDSRFKFIVVGLWLPFILGILKVFLTNNISPFFAKIIMGMILGVSYIPIFVPVGIIFVGFLLPELIKIVKKRFFTYKIFAGIEENLEKNGKKAS